VRRGEELDVRADLHVVADGHPGHVQQHHAEVDEDTAADNRLVPVVAVQRRSDLGTVAGGAPSSSDSTARNAA